MVIEHFPWGRYRIQILTVERPKEDLVVALLENYYRRIQRMTTWGEELPMHGKEAASLSDEEIMGVIRKVCDEHNHVGMVPKENRYFLQMVWLHLTANEFNFATLLRNSA